MNTDPNNLHPKFYPNYLSHPACLADITKESIDTLLRSAKPLKSDYIFDAGNWIFKLPRTDALLTPDTHLYRIRKAEKIRKYISQCKLGDHLIVPQKYLYWHESEGKFYVVCQKLDLSEEVAQPASQDIEDALKEIALGQCEALRAGKRKRALTSIQAKALAELSLLGYTDLSYNNLFFTRNGQIAILDTEPVKRSFKKTFKNNLFAYWMGDKGAILTQQSITGIAKLKLYCSDPNALKEVKKVERNHVLWRLTQLIGKIALLALSIYFVPSAMALNTLIKVTFITVATVKILMLTLCALYVFRMWSWSCQGLPGVELIAGIEAQGMI